MVILFVGSRENAGVNTVRKDITQILEKSSSNVGSVRTYIASTGELMKDGDNYTLSISGNESHKEILKEIKDENIENKFDISKSKTENKGTKTKSYQVMDLDLTEEKRKLFKVFFAEKKPKGQPEQMLTIIYWLSENSSITTFKVNEVYTGFNIVNEKSPKSIESVLHNLKSDGKLDRPSTGNYKINHVGKDFVKFDLPKATSK